MYLDRNLRRLKSNDTKIGNDQTKAGMRNGIEQAQIDTSCESNGDDKLMIRR